MLTRLKVTGFKNLLDVDVSFGPFTCLIGPTGSGKSSLLDAIVFLGALASDRTLAEAAYLVAGVGGTIPGLFLDAAGTRVPQMSFEAEMLVPEHGVDDLGQPAQAGITFLHYGLVLAWREAGEGMPGALQVISESLSHITLGAAHAHLRFPHTLAWRRSVVRGRRAAPLISTKLAGGATMIHLHQDGQADPGRSRIAATLPRTMLSSVTLAEHPTALLAKREMQSWHLLRLEPGALRRPDVLDSPALLASNGAHLAAALYHQAQRTGADTVYPHLAARVTGVTDTVARIWVACDTHRGLLTLMTARQDGRVCAAQEQPEGVLRILALAALELDPHRALWCVELPENNIYPSHLPALLQLLRAIPSGTRTPLGPENPPRQVIITTHAPAIVRQVPEDCLLLADTRRAPVDSQQIEVASFAGLRGTWRERVPAGPPCLPRETLEDYLREAGPPIAQAGRRPRRTRRPVAKAGVLQLALDPS